MAWRPRPSKTARPERRDGSLSWGLRYIVRVDVLLDDGSVVTLDELADEVGLERLPYLEEMPEELDVDWGEDGSALGPVPDSSPGGTLDSSFPRSAWERDAAPRIPG